MRREDFWEQALLPGNPPKTNLSPSYQTMFSLPRTFLLIPPRLRGFASAASGCLLAAVCHLAPGTAFAQVADRSIPLDCGGWVSGFAVHSSGRLYAYGDVFGAWRSNDAGQSWKYLQGNFTVNDNFVTGMAVASGSADTLAFITEKNFYKSTDGGTTWSTLLSNMTTTLDRGASPVIFQPGNDSEVWLAGARAGLTGYLWRSTDGGANWSKVGGSTFDAVRVTTIYVRPEFPDQIWVGAVGGLYVSTDHGANWTLVWNNGGANNPPDGKPPTVWAIARRSDGIGYFAANVSGYRVTATDFTNAATYVATAVISRVNGSGPVSACVLVDNSFVSGDNASYVKRSTDGGVNWTALGMDLLSSPTPVYLNPATPGTKAAAGRSVIVQDPTNASRWFMTGGKSMVITNDSGSTWSYPPNGSGMAGVMTMGKVRFPRANRSMVLVSGADQGAFVLTDGGASGKAASCSRTSIDKHATFHEVMSSDDGMTLVAAGCGQEANVNILYRSTDGGVTWSEQSLASSGLPASYEGVTRAVAAPGNVNDFLVLLGYNSGKPNNNPGLYRTTDGGATFTKVGGSSFDGVDTGMRYHQENSYLETDGVNTATRYLALRSANVSSARGFWRSTDSGNTWAKTTGQPFGTNWIHCMVVDPTIAGRVWVTGDYLGLKRSDDGGDSWVTVTGFTNAARVDAANGWVAVWGRRGSDTWNKLYYSADNGANWTEMTGTGYRYSFLKDLAVDPWNFGEVWISGISVNVINPPAAWFTFAQSAQFSGNFQVITNNGVAWNAGGYLQHASAGGYQTSTMVYDTTPDATPTNAAFGQFTVKLDFQVTGAGNGLGIYFYNGGNRTSSAHYRLQVNEAYSSGGTGERSRWITGANMTGSGGTSQKDSYISTALTTGLWYRLELSVTPTGGGNATATTKVYDQHGSTVLASDSCNLTGLGATTGEIGLSLLNANGAVGQRDVLVDNFRILN